MMFKPLFAFGKVIICQDTKQWHPKIEDSAPRQRYLLVIFWMVLMTQFGKRNAYM
jgi:hypothetical protein